MAWCWLRFRPVRRSCVIASMFLVAFAGCTRPREERGAAERRAEQMQLATVNTARGAPSRVERLAPARRAHSSACVFTQVAAFAALLGRADADTRHPAWNAYNNPDVLGPLGCWYFSDTYKAMTNAVLAPEDVAAIIRAAPAPQDLLWLGQQLFDGDMIVRDVHAARALYTHVAATAADDVTRMYALRFLAETWASPLTADRDYARAIPLFQEVFDHHLARGDAAEDIDANINLHWALYGLMECYHRLGMRAEKAALIAAYTARAPQGINTAGAVAFGEALIQHHDAPKDPAGLRAIADAYDRVACDYYGDNARHSMVQKCRVFAAYFRQLADKVAAHQP